MSHLTQARIDTIKSEFLRQYIGTAFKCYQSIRSLTSTKPELTSLSWLEASQRPIILLFEKERIEALKEAFPEQIIILFSNNQYGVAAYRSVAKS